VETTLKLIPEAPGHTAAGPLMAEGAGGNPVPIQTKLCGPAVPQDPVALTRNQPPVNPGPTFTLIELVLSPLTIVMPVGSTQVYVKPATFTTL
jgi:hypothetical protein